MSEPPPAKGPARKRWIIDRLQEGAKQTDLARQLGVTRQAIFETWKRYQREGEAFFERKGRRPRETDTLASGEKREFVEWLRNNPPSAAGEEKEFWSLYGVKRAIRKRLGKSVKVAIASELLWTAFPDGPPGKPEMPAFLLGDDDEEEDHLPPLDFSEDQPAAAPPPAADEDPDLPSVEEMERMNRETLGGKAPPIHPDLRGVPGLRTGKHAKGKKNPRPKPKRRKKRR